MNITVHLSDESILKAIHRLNLALDNLRWGIQDTVECLAEDGAMIANAAYGGMDANAVAYSPDEGTAVIDTVGKVNVIAEFGAGDATIPGVGFENPPDTPTYAGSYSESDEGSGMYVERGYWVFGGKVYREIEPRMGLLRAKVFIIETAVETAKEVIKL